MTISERIFELLEQQHKKQNKLAEHLEVRASTISEWKTKNTSPSSDLLEKISTFFNVSVDYLVKGKEFNYSMNQGIIGNSNNYNTIKINGDSPRVLSEIETELLNICGKLSTRKKAELLTLAYKMCEEE